MWYMATGTYLSALRERDRQDERGNVRVNKKASDGYDGSGAT